MAWKEVELGEVTVNHDRRRIPLNSSERDAKSENGLYPYVGANKILTYIDEYIFDEKIICIAEDGGDWSRNSRCAFIMNEKCWVNNHAHVLTAKDSMNLEFLMYYLNRTDLSLHITGATRGKLTQGSLSKIKIPLPPLPVQKKIADILDMADACRQKTKALLDKYDELAQSIFLDMFGDPVKNEKGWEVTKLEEVCDKITDGTHHSPPSQKNGYKYVTAKHIKPYVVDFNSKPS